MSGPKNEAPGDMSAEGQETCRGGSPDSIEATTDSKDFATLQAQFSLKGYALLRLANGVMLAERWGFTRQLDTMTQAAQFLHQIGGAR